jgi:hypothetical protein
MSQQIHDQYILDTGSGFQDDTIMSQWLSGQKIEERLLYAKWHDFRGTVICKKLFFIPTVSS